jgi:polyhydroxyalkanoate synthesis regulator phasin
MKTVIIFLLFIVVLAGVGYFGLPVLIQKETSGLKTDIQDIHQRLQKIEEESKAAPLPPDADVQKVIKTVNAMYAKTFSLEDSFNKSILTIDETMKKQNTMNEDALKKQAEAIANIDKETQAKIQGIMFDATMANIRGHILKARVELVAKNVGTAKGELDLINELFSKAAIVSSDENKKSIRELQTSLQKARTEIDTDLPAALNKIDLLWYEMSKLLRKI